MRTLFSVVLTGALAGSLGPLARERSRNRRLNGRPTRSSA